MAAELRSCPFCGGKAMLCEAGGYWVNCLKCNTNGAYEKTEEEAAEAWNRRVTAHDEDGWKYETWSVPATEENMAKYGWFRREICQFVIEDNMNETEGMGDVWFRCTNCNMIYDYLADEWLMRMAHCPNCGAKVVV